MRAIFCILNNTKVALPSSLCNFAGILLAKFEATFGTLTGFVEDDEDVVATKVEEVADAYTKECLEEKFAELGE